MISFSDRRMGEELHVLERLQRKVKIAIHYLLFSQFSCSFGRPFASMLPPIFSVNFLVEFLVGCICECPLIFWLLKHRSRAMYILWKEKDKYSKLQVHPYKPVTWLPTDE